MMVGVFLNQKLLSLQIENNYRIIKQIYMKKLALVIVLIIAVLAASCVSKKKCPAYSSVYNTEMRANS